MTLFEYQEPKRLLNTIVWLLDQRVFLSNKNLASIATKIIESLATHTTDLIPDLKAILFLLTLSELDRTEILAQCDFLKAGGR